MAHNLSSLGGSIGHEQYSPFHTTAYSQATLFITTNGGPALTGNLCRAQKNSPRPSLAYRSGGD